MRSKRGGFTLIELLVVMAIIALLASLLYGAMWHAETAARRENTRASIRKLAAHIAPIWESYETRRLPTGYGYEAIIRTRIARGAPDPLPSANETLRMHQANLDGMRALRQAELPDQWRDVTAAPAWIRQSNPQVMRYQRYMAGLNQTTKHQAAECLWMIVHLTRAGDGTDFRLDTSNMSEGDADNDGAMEFQDGWGNPIAWIRQPFAFVSDVQPLPHNPDTNPDILDWHGIDASATGYNSTPLIFSGGPDATLGINQRSGNRATWGRVIGPGAGDNINSHEVRQR